MTPPCWCVSFELLDWVLSRVFIFSAVSSDVFVVSCLFVSSDMPICFWSVFAVLFISLFSRSNCIRNAESFAGMCCVSRGRSSTPPPACACLPMCCFEFGVSHMFSHSFRSRSDDKIYVSMLGLALCWCDSFEVHFSFDKLRLYFLEASERECRTMFPTGSVSEATWTLR